mmetsp:Transcript_613/g.1279  ORF Transcript_613/g.1279 Transcript_613/m.1279 type:complete len:1642 (-) Transcript_613:1370-6295(-)
MMLVHPPAADFPSSSRGPLGGTMVPVAGQQQHETQTQQQHVVPVAAPTPRLIGVGLVGVVAGDHRTAESPSVFRESGRVSRTASSPAESRRTQNQEREPMQLISDCSAAASASIKSRTGTTRGSTSMSPRRGGTTSARTREKSPQTSRKFGGTSQSQNLADCLPSRDLRGVKLKSPIQVPQFEMPNCRIIYGEGAVFLHIYDLDSMTARINQWAMTLANAGIFHVGVELFGDEWYYRQACDDSTGIVRTQPMCHGSHAYRSSYYMGESPLSPEQFWRLLLEMKKTWKGSSYDLLRRNCQHFALEVCRLLGVAPVPEFVTRLPLMLNPEYLGRRPSTGSYGGLSYVGEENENSSNSSSTSTSWREQSCEDEEQPPSSCVGASTSTEGRSSEPPSTQFTSSDENDHDYEAMPTLLPLAAADCDWETRRRTSSSSFSSTDVGRGAAKKSRRGSTWSSSEKSDCGGCGNRSFQQQRPRLPVFREAGTASGQGIPPRPREAEDAEVVVDVDLMPPLGARPCQEQSVELHSGFPALFSTCPLDSSALATPTATPTGASPNDRLTATASRSRQRAHSFSSYADESGLSSPGGHDLAEDDISWSASAVGSSHAQCTTIIEPPSSRQSTCSSRSSIPSGSSYCAGKTKSSIRGSRVQSRSSSFSSIEAGAAGGGGSGGLRLSGGLSSEPSSSSSGPPPPRTLAGGGPESAVSGDEVDDDSCDQHPQVPEFGSAVEKESWLNLHFGSTRFHPAEVDERKIPDGEISDSEVSYTAADIEHSDEAEMNRRQAISVVVPGSAAGFAGSSTTVVEAASSAASCESRGAAEAQSAPANEQKQKQVLEGRALVPAVGRSEVPKADRSEAATSSEPGQLGGEPPASSRRKSSGMFLDIVPDVEIRRAEADQSGPPRKIVRLAGVSQRPLRSPQTLLLQTAPSDREDVDQDVGLLAVEKVVVDLDAALPYPLAGAGAALVAPSPPVSGSSDGNIGGIERQQRSCASTVVGGAAVEGATAKSLASSVGTQIAGSLMRFLGAGQTETVSLAQEQAQQQQSISSSCNPNANPPPPTPHQLLAASRYDDCPYVQPLGGDLPDNYSNTATSGPANFQNPLHSTQHHNSMLLVGFHEARKAIPHQVGDDNSTTADGSKDLSDDDTTCNYGSPRTRSSLYSGSARRSRRKNYQVGFHHTSRPASFRSGEESAAGGNGNGNQNQHLVEGAEGTMGMGSYTGTGENRNRVPPIHRAGGHHELAIERAMARGQMKKGAEHRTTQLQEEDFAPADPGSLAQGLPWQERGDHSGKSELLEQRAADLRRKRHRDSAKPKSFNAKSRIDSTVRNHSAVRDLDTCSSVDLRGGLEQAGMFRDFIAEEDHDQESIHLDCEVLAGSNSTSKTRSRELCIPNPVLQLESREPVEGVPEDWDEGSASHPGGAAAAPASSTRPPPRKNFISLAGTSLQERDSANLAKLRQEISATPRVLAAMEAAKLMAKDNWKRPIDWNESASSATCSEQVAGGGIKTSLTRTTSSSSSSWTSSSAALTVVSNKKTSSSSTLITSHLRHGHRCEDPQHDAFHSDTSSEDGSTTGGGWNSNSSSSSCASSASCCGSSSASASTRTCIQSTVTRNKGEQSLTEVEDDDELESKFEHFTSEEFSSRFLFVD